MQLAKIDEKEKEAQILQNQTMQDVQVNDMCIFKELIVARVTCLSIQQREMKKLEEF